MEKKKKIIVETFHQATQLTVAVFTGTTTPVLVAKKVVIPNLPNKLISKLLNHKTATIQLLTLPHLITVATFTINNATFIIWTAANAVMGNGTFDDRVQLTDFNTFKSQVTLLFLTLTQEVPQFTKNQLDLTDYDIIDRSNQQTSYYREHVASYRGYLAERKMLRGVEHGNLEEFNTTYLAFMNEGNFGTLANSDLRSKKNMTVAATTLFTRAAIRGGMFAEAAYDLSDECIKKTEKLNAITNIYEYTRTIGERFVQNVAQAKRRNLPSIVYQAQEYIYTHLAEITSATEIAKHVGCSRSYLMHLFRDTTGVSLNNFLIAQRISSAKQQLLFTQLPINDIADSLGYSSQAQLSRSFKQATGLSPMQFRKNQSVY